MCKALLFVGGYWEAVGEAIGRLLGGYWEAAGDPPTVNRSGSAKSCRRPRTQAFVSLGPRLVVRMMACLTDPIPPWNPSAHCSKGFAFAIMAFATVGVATGAGFATVGFATARVHDVDMAKFSLGPRLVFTDDGIFD